LVFTHIFLAIKHVHLFIAGKKLIAARTTGNRAIDYFDVQLVHLFHLISVRNGIFVIRMED